MITESDFEKGVFKLPIDRFSDFDTFITEDEQKRALYEVLGTDFVNELWDNQGEPKFEKLIEGTDKFRGLKYYLKCKVFFDYVKYLSTSQTLSGEKSAQTSGEKTTLPINATATLNNGIEDLVKVMMYIQRNRKDYNDANELHSPGFQSLL